MVFRGQELERLHTDGLERVTRAIWMGESLLVRAHEEGSSRADWWLMSPEGVTNVTSGIATPPSMLIPVGDGLLGLSGGDLWRFSIDSTPVNLTATLAAPISTIRSLDRERGLFLITVDAGRQFLRVLRDTVLLSEVENAPPGFRLRAVAPSADALIYQDQSGGGTRLWLVGGCGRPLSERVEFWSGNEWVRELALGRAEYFHYAGTDGSPLGGWLLLPHDGRIADGPLPLVTLVYPGATYTADRPPPFDPLSANFLQPQLFAALGYAVLLPSMPTPEDRLRSDPLWELPIGVLPALDTLVSRGIADPDRLAVIGQSAGGYATLGLVAQTSRFKAAIATASYSNLVSLYGTFYGQRRYGDTAHPQSGQVLRMMQMERGYARMGGPPWEQLDRYLRNSPLLHIGKVETPVMLVHGDMDFIPIQQAEEYFTALYRQDKRSVFVRYHGEAHTPTSRANVVDLWMRMEDWLGDLLGAREGQSVMRTSSPE